MNQKALGPCTISDYNLWQISRQLEVKATATVIDSTPLRCSMFIRLFLLVASPLRGCPCNKSPTIWVYIRARDFGKLPLNNSSFVKNLTLHSRIPLHCSRSSRYREHSLLMELNCKSRLATFGCAFWTPARRGTLATSRAETTLYRNGLGDVGEDCKLLRSSREHLRIYGFT